MRYRGGAAIFLVFLWCCLTASFRSAGQNVAFNHLTVENGLSNNSVLSIIQDGQGFMWYGTRYGLNRYDGQRFKIYKGGINDEGLFDYMVNCLFVDAGKALWAGSPNGLNKYNAEKDVFDRITLDPVPPGSRAINCMLEDHRGRMWVGTSSGLYVEDGPQRRKFVRFPGQNGRTSGHSIRSMYEDVKGNLWLGTNNGLTKVVLTGNTAQYEVFRQDKGLVGNFITTITGDHLGRLWIGTQTNGISLYDPATGTFTNYTHPYIINDNIRKVLLDKTGKLWVGTQEGLNVIDPVTKTSSAWQYNPSSKKSLSQNSIHSLFEDNNGSIWIGTYFGGVNMIYSYTTSFITLQSGDTRTGLSNNVISNIVEDPQHHLWIGTEGGGLNYLNRQTNQYTYYKHSPTNAGSLGSNLVKVVYQDADRNIWVGTHGGGLNLLEPGKGTFRKYLFDPQNTASFILEVTALEETAGGRFWVGTSAGLQLFHRKGRELTSEADSTLAGPCSTLSVRTLLEDSKHRLWVGGIGGLYVMTGDSLQRLRKDLYINTIQEDSGGNIWVSLYYGGLLQYSPDLRTTKLFTEKDGLPNNNVMGLLEDDRKFLWISTDNGLAKFDPARNTFQTYTTSDGLAGNNFNYNSFLRDSKGEFFFGGFNGITSFYPDKIAANTHPAPMVFTGLRLFNEPVGVAQKDGLLKQNISLTKSLRFAPKQAVFTIEYALLNYIKSDKNRYAYKLEGADRAWNETNNNAVTYTNLPPGSYTFQVKGANNDGVWSEPVRLNIEILPPFWRTWWAYCLYAILAAGIFFFVTRFFFLRALLKKEEELHQVKLNFFTNISHEIRTHLTLLMAPVEKMMETLKQNTPMREQLAGMKKNADRLLRLVSELMDFRKAETHHLRMQVAEQDLIPFLQEVYRTFEELSQQRHISISFIHSMDHAFLYFDREQLGKVFFNLLTNAFKFTPDGGQILLHAAQEGKTVKVTVTDNGRGIAPEYLDKLFTNFFQVADHGLQNTGYGIGLALSKNIVELHKGTITAESRPASADKEGKTSFTVTLLQGKAHFEGTQHILGDQAAESLGTTSTATVQPVAISDTAAGGQSFTILIVEDNPELRSLIVQTLQPAYQIMESENGALGLEVATTQIPDLVISDVMMPEMDGLAFCHQLKTDERTSHIPVILLTAKSSQADYVSGLETGADLYLTKPFSTRILELHVRNLLTAREKMREKFSRQLQTNFNPPENDTMVNSVDAAFLQKVMQLVEEHMDDPAFGVEMLSRKVAMSQPVLYRKLKAVTNMSVNDFVKSLRLKKAAMLIRKREHTVYEVAYMVGYADRKYFSREFKKQFGKTPSEYAEKEELPGSIPESPLP